VILLILVGCAFLLMVLAAGLLEAWARHRGWKGFDERPVKYEQRRPGGRPW
jgi:hypothetical protein